MKVICINEEWRFELHSYIPTTVPEFGKTYEVIEILEHPFVKNLYGYVLEGFETHVFAVKHFAPVSDIDETEMERNYSRVDQSLFIKH